MAAPASAGPLLSQTVSATSAVDKSCTGGQRTGPGVAQKRVAIPVASSVTARLTAASGDWDLALIDPGSGRVVAGSAYRGSSEVASGFAAQGSNLIVQACRLTGSASSAQISLDSTPIDNAREPERDVDSLDSLGLDEGERMRSGHDAVL